MEQLFEQKKIKKLQPQRIKGLKLGPNERMVSFDATALFPSVPIGDAITLIHELLSNDTTLANRTKLSSGEICDLISLCLSLSNFIYNERHHTQKDSGPIGLSLMVTVSQIWMLTTMQKAIKEAKKRRNSIARHIFIYMDDCWCIMQYPRPGLRSTTTHSTDPAAQFNECLNSIHERVQFTREEEQGNAITFLNVHVTRNDDGTLTTCVYRIASNTNITIKPNSCQHPGTAIATFKSEICQAYRLCSTQEQVNKEIEFILNMFEDNGHDRAKFKKIAEDYTPPKPGEKKNNKQKNNKKTNPGKTSPIPTLLKFPIIFLIFFHSATLK